MLQVARAAASHEQLLAQSGLGDDGEPEPSLRLSEKTSIMMCSPASAEGFAKLAQQHEDYDSINQLSVRSRY